MPGKVATSSHIPIPKNEKIVAEPSLFIPYTKSNLVGTRGSILLANVLCELKSFLDGIVGVRKLAKITKQPFDLPKSAFDRLQYGNKLAEEVLLITQSKEIFRDMCQLLVHRFHLDQNWWVPIQICVLTHHLPVPPNDMGVFIRNQNCFCFNPANIMANLDSPENSNTVALIFTRYAGKNRTIDWMKMNWWRLKPIFKTLPSVKPIIRLSKVRHRNLFLGKMAWYLKNEGYSWIDIVTMLDKLTGDYQKGIFGEYDDNKIRKACEQWEKLLTRVDEGGIK